MARTILCCAVFVLLMLPAMPARAQPAPRAPSVDVRVALQAYQAFVEAELDAALGGLKTAAATEEARSGDWERSRGPLAAYAGQTPLAAAVWMARPDGSFSTVERGAAAETARDRAYLPRLLAGRDVVGELVVGRTTSVNSVIVATPVSANGKIVGALGASLSAEKLAASVERSVRWPANIDFYALDAQGRIAIHRQAGQIFQYPAEQGGPALRKAVRTMLSRPEGVVRYSLGGRSKVLVFRRSASIGWVFALAIGPDVPGHAR